MFITGRPKVGKTTTLTNIVYKLHELFPELKIEGFLTEEVRRDGKRIGFDLIKLSTLDGELKLRRLGPLARLRNSPECDIYKFKAKHYKRYLVFAEPLKNLLEELENQPAQLVIIDEIGAMELMIEGFLEFIIKLLSDNKLFLIATIKQDSCYPYSELRRKVDAIYDLDRLASSSVETEILNTLKIKLREIERREG